MQDFPFWDILSLDTTFIITLMPSAIKDKIQDKLMFVFSLSDNN